MCDTLNDSGAQTCKSCGYIFEDFSSTVMSNPPQWEKPWGTNTSTPAANDFSVPPTISTGSPIFLVSKSLLRFLGQGIVYLLFIALFTLGTSISVYSLGVIGLFILIAFAPLLFTTRKYEFFDDSLRMSKVIGGSSEIPYSDLEILDYSKGRKPQIILETMGQRRRILIPGNPTNAVLGEDLNQFLQKKLKKYDPHPREQQSVSSDVEKDDDATEQV